MRKGSRIGEYFFGDRPNVTHGTDPGDRVAMVFQQFEDAGYEVRLDKARVYVYTGTNDEHFEVGFDAVRGEWASTFHSERDRREQDDVR